ncbi:MAG: rhodanese-like domain-containing protein [Ignavibacteria bacterium]|nr:rhodanese-like domain-containing protein [Ignavibacteria bacterium]
MALREAGMLLIAAAALGFIYTAAMEKGLFGTQRAGFSSSFPTSVNAPVTISPDSAKMFFDSGNALFVDSRHAYDYSLGHIKGSINLPLAEYAAKKDTLARVPKDKLIIIYCDGADCNSSIELAARLFMDGFVNVKIFFGGWGEWKAKSLPIEKSAK